MRYNKLIATIVKSLKDIQSALKGEQLMSDALEEVIVWEEVSILVL